jgi:hypothetical protein
MVGFVVQYIYMATQQEYEALVSINPRYKDFTISLRDLPSTEGRLEHFLSQYNVPVKHLRLLLVVILFLIPFSVISFFVLNHPSLSILNAQTQESLQRVSDLTDESY